MLYEVITRIENDRRALILVDYAHTGDALEKVLQTVAGLSPRITSYNVCYTKLLRFLGNVAEQPQHESGQGVDVLFRQPQIEPSIYRPQGSTAVDQITPRFEFPQHYVITSYSIHYTKLYDPSMETAKAMAAARSGMTRNPRPVMARASAAVHSRS